jgi:uncharacterized protein YebE (UPF0316 family)
MDFLSEQSVWLYILIFFGRIMETLLGIIWLILISRGERLASSVIMLMATGLWILVAGTVLVGFQTDILKSIIYVLASAVGVYVGASIEEKLALGLSSLQVIVPQDNVAHENQAFELAKLLRSKDFAVTVLQGKGRLGKRDILTLHLKRKRIKTAIKIVKSQISNAVIVVNDVKSISGGYLRNK